MMSGTSKAHGIPAAKIARYRKILAKLAPGSGATAAEQSTARKLLSKMDAEYPGIRAWATMPEVDLPFNDTTPPPPGTRFDGGGWTPPPGSPLHGAFGFAQRVWSAVSVRQRVANLMPKVRVRAKTGRAGTVRVTVDVPADVLDAAYRIDDAGLTILAEAAGVLAARALFDEATE